MVINIDYSEYGDGTFSMWIEQPEVKTCVSIDNLFENILTVAIDEIADGEQYCIETLEGAICTCYVASVIVKHLKANPGCELNLAILKNLDYSGITVKVSEV